jgi:hypothetical protein
MKRPTLNNGFFHETNQLMVKPRQTSLKESTQNNERKGKKGQGPKSRQVSNPKEANHMEVNEPLSTKTSISRLQHIH